MIEVQFLFDNQLIAALETLIKESKHRLFLVSPFIDLDKRIQDALREKLTEHDLEIKVLFGKNENNIYKSIKKDSVEFFKQFPNIEIRYNDRLHAKFYLNDFNFITTSLNLYDYSLANNIEVGIICNHGTKGLLGKVLDGTDTIISQGVDKVKHDVLGIGNKDVNPIEKFESIFAASELKYKTKPIITEQSGIIGVFGGKKLNGFNIIVDNLRYSINETKYTPPESISAAKPVANSLKHDSNFKPSSKTMSASQLSKLLGVSQSDITNLMQKAGLIDGEKITIVGQNKGLVMKNYMGKDYIAYPDNLEELNIIKK